MSGETPGRAAYEAAVRVMLDGDTEAGRIPDDGPDFAWDAIGSLERASWEAAAQAVIAAQQPQPAPELAAAMAETRGLRELVTDMLTTFTATGSGHAARVGQVQIAKWRERAGLPK